MFQSKQITHIVPVPKLDASVSSISHGTCSGIDIFFAKLFSFYYRCIFNFVNMQIHLCMFSVYLGYQYYLQKHTMSPLQTILFIISNFPIGYLTKYSHDCG